MLSGIMMNVVLLNVAILNVVVPLFRPAAMAVTVSHNYISAKKGASFTVSY